MRFGKNGERISTTRKTPSYQRIATDLRTKVASGQMAPGIMLPGRRDLAVEYGVSVQTIERAVADLLSEGTLRADRRRGTFVGTTAGTGPVSGSADDGAPPETDSVLASPHMEQPAADGNAAPAQAPPMRSTGRANISSITVGIVSHLADTSPESEIMTHYSYTMISAIEQAITRFGGRSQFYNLWGGPNERIPSVEGYEALVRDGVDVVLVVNVFKASHFPALFRAVEAARVPLVVVNEDKVSTPLFSVFYDHADAAYQAAQHLFEQGCSEIVFFSARSAPWVQGRWEGTLRAAHDSQKAESAVIDRINRTAVESESAWYGAFQGGHAWARALLESEGALLLNGRRGVIAANDQMATGFIKAASELGFLVRRDYVITGFDDQSESRQLGLSTMRPPLEEMGRAAVRLALQIVEEELSPRGVRLHSHLVARSSSRFEYSLNE